MKHFRLLGVVVLLALAVGVPARGSSVTGEAGQDTALPDTDSAVTVAGRGRFADLKVKVNQTKNLLNQAVSVTWTGGAPTQAGPGQFGRNYLQIFQCWGDDDGEVASNPGPAPEQCAQGATQAVYGGRNDGNFPPGSFSATRIISNKDWKNYDPNVGVIDPSSGYVYRDFVAVTGEKVGVPVDSSFNPDTGSGSFWRNSFFNIITTNEIAAGRTLANGTGSELFEVHTGLENTGLGCGQAVQPQPDGSKKIPKCWLVIVPRSTPTDENAGTPTAGSVADQSGVTTSPVAADQWKNRIAVPLEFNPVDTACQLSDDQRRVIGSELVGSAVASWQPKLCETPGRQPFAFAPVSDSSARQQLASSAPGSAGMIVTSEPLDTASLDPDSPVVYAPIALSGVVIGFNIERNTDIAADDAARKLQGIRVQNIRLTPRLLAKLLTQSYPQMVNIKKNLDYDWLKNNPPHLGKDKDFLKFNPEFKELQNSGKNLSGFVQPVANSDAAKLLWNYVFADPEAKKWLDGAPDEFGMKVNPAFLTTGVDGKAPAFGDPAPESFPKNEPFCYQAPNFGPNSLTPPPLCGTDWVPFVQAFRDAARAARAGDDGAKIIENPFADSADKYYTRDLPQPLGQRAFLSLTDSASAYQYGLQTAMLSRAGDDGDDRTFIAPTTDTLEAALAGFAAKDEPAVMQSDPSTKVANGYPLAMLTYAAIKPLALDDAARSDYADFVAFAAGDGQTSGLKFGQLPPGYAPLPAPLRTQSAAAAKTIRELKPGETPGEVESAGETARGDDGSSTNSFAYSNTNSSNYSSSNDPATMTSPSPSSSKPSNNKGLLKRVLTPAVAAPVTRFALPAIAGLALLAGLGAAEVTKRPRRPVSNG